MHPLLGYATLSHGSLYLRACSKGGRDQMEPVLRQHHIEFTTINDMDRVPQVIGKGLSDHAIDDGLPVIRIQAAELFKLSVEAIGEDSISLVSSATLDAMFAPSHNPEPHHRPVLTGQLTR